MKTTHKHAAQTSQTRPFCGCTLMTDHGRVVGTHREAAHGGVCERQTCKCGATRDVNINGAHREVGVWIER